MVLLIYYLYYCFYLYLVFTLLFILILLFLFQCVVYILLIYSRILMNTSTNHIPNINHVDLLTFTTILILTFLVYVLTFLSISIYLLQVSKHLLSVLLISFIRTHFLVKHLLILILPLDFLEYFNSLSTKNE
jgi:hypothetical protein